jgi:hypothetical protein
MNKLFLHQVFINNYITIYFSGIFSIECLIPIDISERYAKELNYKKEFNLLQQKNPLKSNRSSNNLFDDLYSFSNDSQYAVMPTINNNNINDNIK